MGIAVLFSSGPGESGGSRDSALGADFKPIRRHPTILNRRPAGPWLLTTAEVAQLLRVSRRTVCLLAELSELPAIRVGKQWRFRAEQIQRLVRTEG
ncbi:MAG TPA: helix-turn-helix domain-containing protein [Terriglobia bacterium]|nr:helix-turn-helix domain-containing protein [Terriglobia bacterium]